MQFRRFIVDGEPGLIDETGFMRWATISCQFIPKCWSPEVRRVVEPLLAEMQQQTQGGAAA